MLGTKVSAENPYSKDAIKKRENERKRIANSNSNHPKTQQTKLLKKVSIFI